MTLELIHTTLPVIAVLSIYVIVRHWHTHWRLGFAGEVIGLAPFMFLWDVMAIFFAINIVLSGVHEFSGHAFLSYPSAPTSTRETVFVSMVCFGALFLTLKFNSGDRFFDPTVAGIREGAIRTLLTLRIIDRIENIAKKITERKRL